MAAPPVIVDKQTHTFRQYEDDDHIIKDFANQTFNEDTSNKCPVYIQRTPPCQGSCPFGHESRGWLHIVRGIEKQGEDIERDAYASYRNTTANPFSSIMGRGVSVRQLDSSTTGRYVATDYTKCIGCHICSDVCPTGYIDMAMGH